MAMTRKEFLASAASVGALSACAGTRYWLPRKDSLRRSVPYDEELVYLSSNGNQYIDTGVQPFLPCKITMKLETPRASHVFGSRLSSDQSLMLWSIYSTGDNLKRHDWLGDHLSFSAGSEVELYADSNGSSMTVDGVTTSGGVKPIISHNFVLFGVNTAGAVSRGTCTYYNCKIMKGGEVIRDFVPVLKNGVPCLYDNAGSGFYYNMISGRTFGYKKKDGTIVNPI